MSTLQGSHSYKQQIQCTSKCQHYKAVISINNKSSVQASVNITRQSFL